MPQTLQLPRPLVNHLLHLAQIAPGGRIAARGDTLFALLNAHPDTAVELTAQELADPDFPDTPRFIISLNTQGVLELRGFLSKPPADRQEIELELSEE